MQRGVNGLQPAQLSPRELILWTAGWLAGYTSGEIAGYAGGHDDHGSRCIEYYAELVRLSGRKSEIAGRSKAWNEQHRTSP